MKLSNPGGSFIYYFMIFRRLLGKFHPLSFKTMKLVFEEMGGRTDRHGYIDSFSEEYIYYIESEISALLSCKLLTETNTLCKRQINFVNLLG